MDYNQSVITQPQLIEIVKLEKSPQNARRTVRKDGVDELKASILAHGLMQNLLVTAAGKGKYHVIAGARRLEALQALQQEGKIPDGHTVPCQIVATDRGLEMSLAENTVRLAMHPADEFEAFSKLSEQGESAEAIASRFGVEEKHVLKRLKLGRVAPALLKEYREGGLDLECLMAFTIIDDRKKQLKVYKGLQDWQKSDPREIRAILTEKMMDADSSIARFVGMDAYLAAGGVAKTDLFGEDVYLENPGLLHRLAGEKLDGIRQEIEAEGWGWIEVNPERDWNLINQCSRVRPVPAGVPEEVLARIEQAEAEARTALEEIEARGDNECPDELYDRQRAAEETLEQAQAELMHYLDFDPEQKAFAGCYVSISHDGAPTIEKGLVKKEDSRKLAKSQAGASDDTEPTEPVRDKLPESLRRDLETYRQQVAQVEIATHRLIALDLMVFTVARSVLSTPVLTGPDARFTPKHSVPRSKETTKAAERLEAIRATLPLEWMQPECEAEQFRLFTHLKDTDKLDLLAYCVAQSLKPQLAITSRGNAYEEALALTEASVAGYWRPSRDNYLSRINREQLLVIGREILGEQWAQARVKDKKSELAAQLERAFAAPEKNGRKPEQVEKLKNWLPAGMAFGGIPVEQAPDSAKKARKAA